jgi:hypothetical protein
VALPAILGRPFPSVTTNGTSAALISLIPVSSGTMAHVAL